MADVKISGLPASSTPLAGTEVLPIVQSGVTDQVSVANLTAGRAVSAASLLATAATTGSSSQGAVAYGTLGYSDVNHLATFQTSVASYAQVEIQNTSTDPAASADMVVGNNLTTASTYYGDFGMNSSGWAGSAPFNTANNVYLTATTASLALGTTTSNTLLFATNSTLAATISTSQVFSTVNDASINGITVGKGGGNVSSNTAVGYQAGNLNSTGQALTLFGDRAGYSSTAGNNAAFGNTVMYNTTTGQGNAAFGGSIVGVANPTLNANVTGSFNTAFGVCALAATTTSNNTAVGHAAGYLATGANNQFFGYSSGSAITTGASNVILGAYTGSAAPISATGSNYVVLSDGAGNVRAYWNGSIGIFNGTISPVQATTAAAPTYVKGAIYFDTTLNKLRVGGATAWETITSV
jgi:hypothetical protein